MKTLNRSITQNFFADENGYSALQVRWADYVTKKGLDTPLNASHHLLYAVLRGKDWTKGFTKITNKVKLDNGMREDWGTYLAINSVYSASRHPVFKDANNIELAIHLINRYGYDQHPYDDEKVKGVVGV